MAAPNGIGSVMKMPHADFQEAISTNSLPENVSGFAAENEALLWIKNESEAWLHQRRALDKKEAAK
jgi:hypothetical protein